MGADQWAEGILERGEMKIGWIRNWYIASEKSRRSAMEGIKGRAIVENFNWKCAVGVSRGDPGVLKHHNGYSPVLGLCNSLPGSRFSGPDVRKCLGVQFL